jgi:hypothetical protein
MYWHPDSLDLDPVVTYLKPPPFCATRRMAEANHNAGQQTIASGCRLLAVRRAVYHGNLILPPQSRPSRMSSSRSQVEPEPPSDEPGLPQKLPPAEPKTTTRAQGSPCPLTAALRLGDVPHWQGQPRHTAACVRKPRQSLPACTTALATQGPSQTREVHRG